MSLYKPCRPLAHTRSKLVWDEGVALGDPIQFRALIRSLQYLTLINQTWPDISGQSNKLIFTKTLYFPYDNNQEDFEVC